MGRNENIIRLNSYSMKVLYLILWLILICACNTAGIPKEALELTEERMKLYYLQQDSICRQKAFQKAEAAVDSFFLSIRQQYLHDSIEVPLKPIKPAIDTNIILNDSIPVKPLWDSIKIKE